MSKAEKFISDCTMNCSNEIDQLGADIAAFSEYYPWITPDQAIIAVEIAREEIYKWLANHYRDYMHNPTGEKLEAFFGGDMINDLKQAIIDE